MDTVYITCIIYLRKGETEFYLGKHTCFVCVWHAVHPSKDIFVPGLHSVQRSDIWQMDFSGIESLKLIKLTSNLPTLTLLWTILNLAGFESTQGKNINPHPRNIKTAWENSQFEALNFQNYDHDEWFFNKVKSISLYSTNQNFHKFFTDLGLTLSRSKAYGFSRP